jgi:hypothetical protein
MFSNFKRIFASLGNDLILRGDTSKAIEVVHRAMEIVPSQKMPNDFFSIGLAEVLIRAGKKEEGEMLLKNILAYARTYLEYSISIRPEERWGLDYAMGISMQSMLDIYNLSVKLKLDSLTAAVEPEINNYYSRLYSVK